MSQTTTKTEVSTIIEAFGPAPKSAKLPRKNWDVEKALKMRLKGEIYSKIGEEVGVPWKTVQSKLKQFLAIEDVGKELEEFRKREASLIDGTRVLALAQLRKCLVDERRANLIHPQTLAWIYGVLYDKQRLERGESTQNLGVFTAVVEAIHRPVKEVVLEAEIIPTSQPQNDPPENGVGRRGKLPQKAASQENHDAGT